VGRCWRVGRRGWGELGLELVITQLDVSGRGALKGRRGVYGSGLRWVSTFALFCFALETGSFYRGKNATTMSPSLVEFSNQAPISLEQGLITASSQYSPHARWTRHDAESRDPPACIATHALPCVICIIYLVRILSKQSPVMERRRSA